MLAWGVYGAYDEAGTDDLSGIKCMSELAHPLRQEIEQLRSRGEFVHLIDVCKRALQAARHTSDLEGQAVAYLGLATAYRYTGQYNEARVLNQEGVQKLAVQLGSTELLTEGLLQAAELRLMGSFQFYEARDLYREALDMAHRGHNERSETEAMIGLGLTYDVLGLHPTAKNYAREGLGNAHIQKIHVLECQALNIMGRILQREKDHERALRCHQHALDISREFNLKLYEAESLYHMGRVYGPHDPAKAVTHYRQALDIAEETQCLEQQYYIWGGLGDAYAHARDFVAAFNAFDHMLSTATQHENRLQEAFAFSAMGRAHLMEGDSLAAVANFEQMRTLTHDHNNPLGEATALEGLARAFETDQQFVPMIEAIKEARLLYMSLDDEAAVRRVTGRLVLAYLKAAWDHVLRLLGMRS